MAGSSKSQDLELLQTPERQQACSEISMHIQIWRHYTGSMGAQMKGVKPMCFCVYVHVPWYGAPTALGVENHKVGLTLYQNSFETLRF